MAIWDRDFLRLAREQETYTSQREHADCYSIFSGTQAADHTGIFP